MQDCSGATEFKPPYFSKDTPPPPASRGYEYIIYVDPKIGDDNNVGTIYKPMRTIQAAVKLYQRRKTQKSDTGIIYLKKGVYYLNEPVVIEPEDSNLVVTGEGRDEVLISGGKKYTFVWNFYRSVVGEVSKDTTIISKMLAAGKDGDGIRYYGRVSTLENCREACEEDTMCRSFTWYSSKGHLGNFSNMCYFRLDNLWHPMSQTGCTSGKKVDILKADLSSQHPVPFTSLFINGRRAVRARYPNGNPETTGLHTDPTGYTKAMGWLPPVKKPAAKEIHIDWPQRNGTRFPQFNIGIGGPVDVFHPPESYWGVAEPNAGDTYRVPSGLKYNQDEAFADRKWSFPSTGVVHVFHGAYWGNWQFSIDDRDMLNHTITWSYGGFQEARGNFEGTNYYVENIMEELDSPGEWFYDETRFLLFYIPNGTNISTGIATSLERLFSIEGTMEDPVYNISITNVTFAHTEPTFLKDYEVPSGGDWAVHRQGGVFAEGVDGLTIKNCLFDSMGGNGLLLSNYIRRAVIDGNEFKRSGDSAILSVGSANLIDGTSGNQPRGTLITNNLIYEMGIFGKQTAAFGQALSAETTISNNILFNGPRAGINMNDGFGGGNTITRNLGFNMVRETADHGIFNSWDRQPYLTKVGDGVTPSLIPATSHITMNFFISNYNSAWPIDHDDGSCYYKDTNNFLVYGGYKNYLGHSHVVQNNVYVAPDSDQTVSVDPMFDRRPYCAVSNGSTIGSSASGWGEVWTDNICIINSSEIYRFRVCSPLDNIADLIPFTANNTFYTFDPSKVFVTCEATNYTLMEFQDMGYDLGSQVHQMLDNSAIIKLGRLILNIKNGQ